MNLIHLIVVEYIPYFIGGGLQRAYCILFIGTFQKEKSKLS
jgi:hypothetical protein